MLIPFIKAQAAGNDFLIIEQDSLAAVGLDESHYAAIARAACHRTLGVGADGIEIVCPAPADSNADALLRIINSDGSEAEISGNGTRCVAAYLAEERGLDGTLRLATAAGEKEVRPLDRNGLELVFEMSMGIPHYELTEVGCTLETSQGPIEVTLLNVGNPQCAVFVDDFELDWRALGAEIETHERFPNRTNVSFIKVVDEHTIETRIWERGAGETASSGTGSTGAAAAAILNEKAKSPVRIVTPAGEMELRWNHEAVLRGPARLVARGEFFYEG